MNYKKLINQLNLAEKIKLKYAEDVQNTLDFLEKNEMKMDDATAEMFLNHIFSMVKRIDEKDCTPVQEEGEVLEQLDKKAIELAKKATEPLFEKYGMEPDRGEIILLATYFSMFLK